ncbi:hypothetical protein M1293_03685 [Candidatus Parvarchaeota archaeon]|nr:hypothetical protein [Candidatus Parvarchaeota archaeon]
MAASASVSIYGSVNHVLQLITPANVTNPIEFWLAFLLLFSILNAVLRNVHFFADEKNKASRGLTALIISFFAVTVAWVGPAFIYISSTLAVTAIVLVAILIVASISGFDISKSKVGTYLFIGAVVSIFLIGGLASYLFVPASGSSVGSITSPVNSAFSSLINSMPTSDWYELVAVVIVLLVGIVVIVKAIK